MLMPIYRLEINLFRLHTCYLFCIRLSIQPLGTFSTNSIILKPARKLNERCVCKLTKSRQCAIFTNEDRNGIFENNHHGTAEKPWCLP